MKSEFRSRLITYWDGEMRVLCEPLVYFCGPLGKEITVPVGFKYDGESVPRWVPIAYAIYSNRSEEAGAVHDFMYSKQSTFTRKEADTVYLDAMQLTGANPWMRKPKWLGVRLFGWLFYKGKPAGDEEQQPQGEVK